VQLGDAEVPVRVEVGLGLGGGRVDPTLEQVITVENLGATVLEARIGIEYAITMLGGGGNPEAWWELAGGRTRHDGSGAARDVDRLAQGNNWLGVQLATTLAPASDAWHAPIETVSNSEAGFERVYQGSALLLSWVIRLARGDTFTASIRHEAKIAMDRAAGGFEAAIASS
jgi:alpha-amylase